MEIRKPKKNISDELGIGEVLDSFKAGPFPDYENVICHLYFHLESMAKKDADLAAWSTADSLLTHWAPSYLPLMTRKNAKTRIKNFYVEFRALLDASRKKRKNALQKKEAFLKKLKSRFDISAEGALDIIAADKTLSTEEKEEDRSFLLAIRDNRPHSLGPLDVKRIRRLDRAAEKERLAIERAEKEKRRREVRYWENAFCTDRRAEGWVDRQEFMHILVLILTSRLKRLLCHQRISRNFWNRLPCLLKHRRRRRHLTIHLPPQNPLPIHQTQTSLDHHHRKSQSRPSPTTLLSL